MKVTSFEISRRLVEIGFKAKTNWCYVWIIDNHPKPHELMACTSESIDWDERDIPAYDLETILEALPDKVEEYYFTMRKYWIFYETGSGKLHPFFTLSKEKNESLGDAAARLLILLHGKGLIKFEVENDE